MANYPRIVAKLDWLTRVRWAFVIWLARKDAVVLNVELRHGEELLRLPLRGGVLLRNVDSVGVMIGEWPSNPLDTTGIDVAGTTPD